jgi:hypothetical protein
VVFCVKRDWSNRSSNGIKRERAASATHETQFCKSLPVILQQIHDPLDLAFPLVGWIASALG